MNKDVLRLTTGAMLTAVFGLLMLVNRQTGGMLEGAFQYILPIPMAAYTALYGTRRSFPVAAAMALLAILLGNVSTLFFEIAHILIGFIFGICLYRKVDTTRTMLIVMAMTALINMVDIVVTAAVTGVSLSRDVEQMQVMMREIAEKAGMMLPEAMMNEGYLLRMLLIGMAFGGALQGFLIYEISLLLLRRLRFQVPKPRNLLSYHPPKWMGLAAGAAVLLMLIVTTFSVDISGNLIPSMEPIFGVCQAVGMIAMLFLAAFGVIAVTGIMNYYAITSKPLRILILVMMVLSMSQLLAFLGFLYIMQMTDLIRAVIQESK